MRPEDREPEPETVQVYEAVFAALERQEAERRTVLTAGMPAAESLAV